MDPIFNDTSNFTDCDYNMYVVCLYRISIQENAFEDIVCEMAAILSRLDKLKLPFDATYCIKLSKWNKQKRQ